MSLVRSERPSMHECLPCCIDAGESLAVQDVPYGVLREQLLNLGAGLDVALVRKPDFSLHGV